MELGTENDRQPSAANKVIKYFGIIMALVYVALGVAIIFGPKENFNISPTYSLPLGCLVIAYGFFRAYKMYRKLVDDEV